MKRYASLGLLASFIGAFGITALQAAPQLDKRGVLKELDFNDDGQLSQIEVRAGLEYLLESKLRGGAKIDLKKLRKKKNITAADLGKLDDALPTEERLFAARFGAPPYSIDKLVADARMDPEREFGLDRTPIDVPPDTTDRWVIENPPVFRVRRTINDFYNDDASSATGALASYTKDFNSKSDQWAFHGVIGLNLTQEINPDFGADAKGNHVAQNHSGDFGWSERWFRPSVAYDKVTTSHGNTDELDSLIYRLAVGGQYDGGAITGGILDGFRFNIAGSYATDSSNRTGIVGGELDVLLFRDPRHNTRLGLNAQYQRVGWFRIRPSITFHMEGGGVTDDDGNADLIAMNDFLRIGGIFGIAIGFEQESGRFYALRGLSFNSSFQYGVEVLGRGPDVDLFIASADWNLDDAGHFHLSAEYRNGRSPLSIQRNNQLTLGLGVKF